MSKKLFIVFIFLLISTLVEVSFSQVAPTGVPIIPAPTKPAEEEVESLRYEKRPARTLRRTIELPKKEIQAKPVELNQEISKPIEQATSLQAVAPDISTTQQQQEEQPPVTDQFRDFFVGGSGEQIDRYRSFLGPDDIRRNKVELELAPLFIYNDSRSEYYFRNYITATPGGKIGLGVWFTPFFGVNANYEKTFLGTNRKEFSGASQSAFLDQWMQLGFRFRRFTSFSATASSMTIGIDFFDYLKKVPVDDSNHAKLATTGVLLSAEARMPANDVLAWLVKLDYMPVANHRELSTDANIRSGLKSETFRMGLSVGTEFKLNRQNRLFFKVKDIYERNVFSGTANTIDPRNGQLPENVAVTNNFIILEVGYTWGH